MKFKNLRKEKNKKGIKDGEKLVENKRNIRKEKKRKKKE
jgi:hypothetical protein